MQRGTGQTGVAMLRSADAAAPTRLGRRRHAASRSAERTIAAASQLGHRAEVVRVAAPRLRLVAAAHPQQVVPQAKQARHVGAQLRGVAVC